MTIHAPFIDGALAAMSATGLGLLAVAQDLPLETKDVSLLAIVSAIGVWLVKTVDKWGDRTTAAIDKGANAQAESAKQMALLMAETKEERRDVEEQGRSLLAAIHELPGKITSAKVTA